MSNRKNIEWSQIEAVGRYQSQRQCKQSYSFNGSKINQSVCYLISQSHRPQIHAEVIAHHSGWARFCGTEQASRTRHLSSIGAAIPSPSSLLMQAASNLLPGAHYQGSRESMQRKRDLNQFAQLRRVLMSFSMVRLCGAFLLSIFITIIFFN